jgi:hypothetical protein
MRILGKEGDSMRILGKGEEEKGINPDGDFDGKMPMPNVLPPSPM